MLHRKVTGVLLVCAVGAAAVDAQTLSDSAEHDYLLRKQQEIFRLNVETDYALAVQKLCQTGYGDPHLCRPSAPTSADPFDRREQSAPPPASPKETLPHHPRDPVVEEISGLDRALSARLRLDDGRVLLVKSGSRLPDGEWVLTIDAAKVVIGTSDRNPHPIFLAMSPSTSEIDP